MQLLSKLLLTSFLTVFLVGCNNSEQKAALQPVVFDKHDRCQICGMVILNYPGAKAQVFIKDNKEALKFCSVKDGFVFILQPENNKRLRNFFVSDFGNAKEIPLNEKMLKAQDAVYVAGSDVRGAMGKSILPFATEDAAKAFKAQHGGTIVKYNEVNLELLNSLKGHKK